MWALCVFCILPIPLILGHIQEHHTNKVYLSLWTTCKVSVVLWVNCHHKRLNNNELTFHHNFYVTWQWQQTCSGLMYKCVPTRAVCLSSAYCVKGTSEMGVFRFESFSTMAVTNPKSPTLIWPSSEKNMFDGCKLK